MRSLPFVEGMMPIQLFLELAGIFGVLTLAVYWLQRFGYRLNKLFQAIATFAIVYGYLRYRLYPPLPFSIFATYLVGASVAIWGWVSSNEAYWKDFCRPLTAMIDGDTPGTRAILTAAVVALPLLVGIWIYSVLLPPDPSTTAPVELRTYNPAPPPEIIVYSPEDFRRCREVRNGSRHHVLLCGQQQAEKAGEVF